MMGRYSLDTPGLIHAGQPFDPSRHHTFPAAEDGILPITNQAYFDDDIVNRFKTLQEQQTELRDYQAKLQTIADSRIELDLDDGVAYNYTRFKGLVYEGSDLKMADLEAKAQWKIELLERDRKLVSERGL
jgi:hypothetical protein